MSKVVIWNLVMEVPEGVRDTVEKRQKMLSTFESMLMEKGYELYDSTIEEDVL